MGTQILNLTKSFQNLAFKTRCNIRPTLTTSLYPSKVNNEIIFTIPARGNANFFNKLPAQHLWKAITSVSNAGRKRGRAKTVSKKNIKDLNRGQFIGVGKANIVWPGLSAPIIRGKELVEQQKLPEDPDREKKLIQLRDTMGTFKRMKLSPIERGWSGPKMPGRSIGPPDPIGEDTFEGFDTKVLELKTVFNMKGNFGRKRRLSVFVVSGNKNGLAGFATGKGLESKTALRKAKNRSGQKLMHIKVFRGHTVYHDFFTQFGSTKIYVSQRPKGHGLICHRAIRTICEAIGIKDLYAKVEGSTNLQHIVKAFFLGLLRQKTHDEIAEDTKLHLVELTKENNYFPKVLASPSEPGTKNVNIDEIPDFSHYCLDGKVILRKKKHPPFYTKLKSYEMYVRKQEKLRGQHEVVINMLAEYGEIRSFLTDKYPECRPPKGPPKKEEEEEKDTQ